MEAAAIPARPGPGAARRHDVDALRTLALGLLIVYHVTVAFQPWGFLVGFIQNREPIEALWPFMSMINVWRIPVLFLISGMGVWFAMERRNWTRLLGDRTLRILLPLVFGSLIICPITVYLALWYYGKEPAWVPNTGHLWFLANIYAYVLVSLPLLVYLKKSSEAGYFRAARRWLQRPMVLALAALPLMAEAWVADPEIFTLYVNTVHGFALGMVCFLTGFVFASLGPAFWRAAEEFRYFALATAFLLYLGRMVFPEHLGAIDALQALECMAWMLAILGLGSRHLNRPSSTLNYFSKAVYPVYIVHLPVQTALAAAIVPLTLAAPVKLLLLLAGTFAVSLALYQFAIRPLKWVRPLFGMKL